MGELPPFTQWLLREKATRRVSLRWIAQRSEVSTDTIKNILDGKTQQPEPETITKIARAFRVDRDSLMAVAGYFAELRPSLDRLRNRDVLRLPLWGSIPAGYPNVIDDDHEKQIELPLTAAQQAQLFRLAKDPVALIVRGQSMVGTAKDGDIVILNPKRPAHSGDVVAALVEGEVTLKRYLVEDDRAILRSTSPAQWPDIEIASADRGIIQGVVVAVYPRTDLIFLVNGHVRPIQDGGE